MRLETNRLLLRLIRPSDVPALIDLWTDPDVTRFMGGPREASGLRNALEEDGTNPAAERFNLWPVEDATTGRVIGHCGLLNKEVDGITEIELVYVLAKPSWGHGFATEIASALRDHAFTAMDLPRLISLIDPENAASERVAKKVGMRFEKEFVRSGGAVRRVYAVEREPVDRTDESA